MTDEETVINQKTAIVTNPISSVTKIYKTLDSLPRVTPELSATLIPSTTEVLATPTKEIITSSMSNPAFVINDLHISVKGDYVKSIWFLQDIPEKMVFNRSGVEANEAEYIWEILIDTDNNPLTGFSDEDLSGVDYAIGIYNFGSRSEEKQLPLNEGVQASVFMAEGYSYTYVSDADLIVDPIENTITLSGYVPGITTNSIFYYEIFDHNSLEEPEHRFLDNVEFLE